MKEKTSKEMAPHLIERFELYTDSKIAAKECALVHVYMMIEEWNRLSQTNNIELCHNKINYWVEVQKELDR